MFATQIFRGISEETVFARIVSILGPVPSELLQNPEFSRKFLDDNDHLIHAEELFQDVDLKSWMDDGCPESRKLECLDLMKG
jgi:hypothetical protein